MNENKKTVWWVVVGVIIAIIIIYLVVSGGALSPSTNNISGEQTPQGTVVVPGASAISEDGQVLTESGEPAKLDVEPGSPEAPKQSEPMADDSAIPKEAIKLSVSAAGYLPSTFEVEAGDPVTISLMVTDGYAHVFKFNSPELSAIAMGVSPGETRAITFNAPTTKGEYSFFCDVPGHTARGETGIMIVK